MLFHISYHVNIRHFAGDVNRALDRNFKFISDMMFQKGLNVIGSLNSLYMPLVKFVWWQLGLELNLTEVRSNN
jgi:hypothetical protein